MTGKRSAWWRLISLVVAMSMVMTTMPANLYAVAFSSSGVEAGGLAADSALAPKSAFQGGDVRRSTMAWELLEALDLQGDAEHSKYAVLDEKKRGDGTRCVKIQIPPIDATAKHPHGLDILYHELDLKGGFGLLFRTEEQVQTRTFYLVIDPQVQLIAVLPVVSKPEGDGQYRYCARFFDLSPYYFRMPALTDPDIANKWAAFGEQWRESQRRIEEALPLVFEEFGLIPVQRKGAYPEYSTPLGTIESVSKEFRPFTLIEFNKEEATTDGYMSSKSAKIFNPDEFGTLQFAPDHNKHQIIIPNYPTVYPAGWHLTGGDSTYYSAIYPGWKLTDVHPGDEVLVIGPGAGLDTWMLWLKAQTTMHVLGLNPLEVANTKMLARIAGMPLQAEIRDHLKDYRKDNVFGGKTFNKVRWNMPFYGPAPNREIPPELKHGWTNRLQYERETYRRQWDGDPNGKTLKEFLAELPHVLWRDGDAVLWNLRGELVGHKPNGEPLYAVESIVMNAGWDEETFYHYNNLNTAVFVLRQPPSPAQSPVECAL